MIYRSSSVRCSSHLAYLALRCGWVCIYRVFQKSCSLATAVAFAAWACNSQTAAIGVTPCRQVFLCDGPGERFFWFQQLWVHMCIFGWATFPRFAGCTAAVSTSSQQEASSRCCTIQYHIWQPSDKLVYTCWCTGWHCIYLLLCASHAGFKCRGTCLQPRQAIPTGFWGANN